MLFDDSTSNNFVTSLYFYQELAQCPVRVRKVAQKASVSASFIQINVVCLVIIFDYIQFKTGRNEDF